MEKPTKLTLTPIQKELLTRLRGGQRLILSFEDGEINYLIDGEVPVNPRTVECLKRNGQLVETGDAMFGISQSLAPSE